MKKTDAAVMILLGQSNATGHGIPMEEKDYIHEPMKHVFGLDRRWNQSFETEKLTWTGYTSCGMNLGETQDDTYSVVNCLAPLWQAEIDRGTELPDLYIIQIAIGAQGVSEKFMWYPEREKKLVPGPLGTVDISLYPLTCHVFSMMERSFRAMGKTYEILGLHWRGGSEDCGVPVEELKQNLDGIYDRMFRGFYEMLGERPPVVLHNIICKERSLFMDPSGEGLKSMAYINEVFLNMERENVNVSVFDIRKCPH